MTTQPAFTALKSTAELRSIYSFFQQEGCYMFDEEHGSDLGFDGYTDDEREAREAAGHRFGLEEVARYIVLPAEVDRLPFEAAYKIAMDAARRAVSGS